MLTTIICESCGEILRKGDIGADIEKKICISCVTRKSPAADLSKIKTLEPTKQTLKNENESFRKKFKKIHIEMPYKYIEGEWILVVELKDYYHRNFAEIGLSKKKLQEFITDIIDIEEKEKKK